MDRQIVYPGAIPLDTDLLLVQRSVLAAFGALAQATLGTNTIVDGLGCSPTSPASLSVIVGPGSIAQMAAFDTLPFGSLPAEPGEAVVKMGVNLDGTTLTLAAPNTAGQAVNYLIEASLLEADATPVVLPYYNASNPSQPYSGPDNSGAPQNTQRLERVQIQAKAGAPGSIGSQVTPPIDAGWVGLYVVTVVYGATALDATAIAAMPGAPFVRHKLPDLSPGVRNLARFTPSSQGNWTVPAGVTAVRVRVWGGGGAGGAGFNGAGGGGAGGGYSEGYYSVAPGQIVAVAVGNGGVGSGSAGGGSSFGALASATGGQAGSNGAPGAAGAGAGQGGVGFGSGFTVAGTPGVGAFATSSVWVSGAGGGTFASPGAGAVVEVSSGSAGGGAGTSPGSGGSGGVGAGLGGAGAGGLVLVEW